MHMGNGRTGAQKMNIRRCISGFGGHLLRTLLYNKAFALSHKGTLEFSSTFDK